MEINPGQPELCYYCLKCLNGLLNFYFDQKFSKCVAFPNLPEYPSVNDPPQNDRHWFEGPCRPKVLGFERTLVKS